MLGKLPLPPTPTLPERPIPTPFGNISLPSIGRPIFALPKVDDRRMRAVKHAVATDMVWVISYIPVVGSMLGESIADLHSVEIRKLLSSQELDQYYEADRRIPSNGLAMLYSFAKSRPT